eukprot:Pgem_evm1s9963
MMHPSTVAANNNQIERTFHKTLNTISSWMKQWRTRLAIDQDKTHYLSFQRKDNNSFQNSAKKKKIELTYNGTPVLSKANPRLL